MEDRAYRSASNEEAKEMIAYPTPPIWSIDDNGWRILIRKEAHPNMIDTESPSTVPNRHFIEKDIYS